MNANIIPQQTIQQYQLIKESIMAIAKGYEAVLKIGTNTVGQCSSFTINKNLETVDTSTIGVTSKQFVSTLDSWNGSCDLFFDIGDTATAELLAACTGGGVTVACNFYVEGTAATVDKYYYGDAFVTSLDWNTTAAGVLEASVSLQGTGTLSEGTAA